MKRISLFAVLALVGCATPPETDTDRRIRYIAGCQQLGSNVTDCTTSAFQLYPENPS